MSPENQHQVPQETTEKELFDIQAADRERLAWRVGGEEPTERALGRDEALARAHKEAVDSVIEAKRDRLAALDIRLGRLASHELRPNDN